jgi:hypothetical protein
VRAACPACRPAGPCAAARGPVRAGSRSRRAVNDRCGWCASREEGTHDPTVGPAPQAAGRRVPPAGDQLLPAAAAAEGKAAKTVRTYTEAVQWFAAACLLAKAAAGGRTCAGATSSSGSPGCWSTTAPRTPATSSALQQFFKWLAGEEDIPDPWPGRGHRPSPTGPSRLRRRRASPVGAENLRHLGRCSADRGWLRSRVRGPGGQVLVRPEMG